LGQAAVGSRPETAQTVRSVSPELGRLKSRTGSPSWTASMYSAHAGPPTVAPVTHLPMLRLPWSKPNQIAVVMSAEKPTVQAATQFWVVPVFPAMGRFQPPSMPAR